MPNRLLTALGIAALCVGQTYAQAFTEYTTAAAAGVGSITGSAAGKKVSDLLNRAAGRVEASGQQKAVAPQSKAPAERLRLPDGTMGSQTVAPTSTPAAPAPPRAGKASGRRGGRNAAPAEPMIAAAYSLVPQTLYSSAVVAPPPARTELLSDLAIGSTRDELRNTIGVPASRVTIPGEGLTEIYYYAKNDSIVGTVRVIDGLVTQVSVY